MLKKVLGTVFIVYAALALIGCLENGSLGIVLISLILLYTLSGIFLLEFDSVYKESYIDGFKARKGQCNKILAFAIIYCFLFLIVCFNSGGIAIVRGYFFVFLTTLPYLIPFGIFVYMFELYVMPYWACKKHCLKGGSAATEYLSDPFNPGFESNDFIMSDTALFFPKYFCVIPFDMISSTKKYQQLWEHGIYFNLTNGKKFYLITKRYDKICAAIDAKKQK